VAAVADLSVGGAHSRVSMGDLSHVAAEVPVHANLFCLCDHGVASSWTDPGNLAGCQKDFKMSSLGRIGI